MKEAKTRYENLRKKYHLPRLEELIREFAVKLEEPNLVLYEIIERIKEKFHNRARILESIIFVASSSDASSMYETKMLEEKRGEMFKIFKELMSIAWKGEKVEASANEKEMATFIRESYEHWINGMKKEYIDICESAEKKWKDASLGERPEEMMYHG